MSSLTRNLCYERRPQVYPVIEKRVVAPGFVRLTISAPAIVQTASPGQFVMLYLPPNQQQQLPRPLSIFKVDRERGDLILFFQVKGEGTRILADFETGSTIKVLGPLGKGFPTLPENSLLVAGGMGIVPLVHLAAAAAIPCTVVYAASTADQLVCPATDLEIAGATLVVATEDGSRGQKGTAVDFASHLLSSDSDRFRAIFSCGPRPMLKSIADLGNRTGLPTWISLEERMACGIGACLGCAVATIDGYKRVCHDGPAFSAEEVIFSD